jgi:hypothetical protein
MGPATGQISPAAEGVDVAPFAPCWACAALMRSAIALLAAWSASISPASARSSAVSVLQSCHWGSGREYRDLDAGRRALDRRRC